MLPAKMEKRSVAMLENNDQKKQLAFAVTRVNCQAIQKLWLPSCQRRWPNDCSAYLHASGVDR
jgi:hypothetical protein